MTGKSPRKKVDALYWQGRLRVAQTWKAGGQTVEPRWPACWADPPCCARTAAMGRRNYHLPASRVPIASTGDELRFPFLGNIIPS
jgi:hypothetical protein